MSQSEKTSIEDLLDGKDVLLIEDDTDLSRDIEELLAELGAKVTLLENIEDAVGEMVKNWKRYTIVIMDVMLPQNRGKLERIRGLQTELEEVLPKIRGYQRTANKSQEDMAKLKLARSRRDALRENISSLIERNGGIDIAERIRMEAKGVTFPPCLFFSALGNEKIQDRAIKAYPGRSKWLVKVGLVDLIQDEIIELLAETSGDHKNEGE